MKYKKIIKILITIIIVILVTLLIIRTDFKEIWSNLKNTSIYIILLLILLQLITQLLLTMQWNIITKKILGHSSIKKMFYIISTGSVIEAITPGAKVGGEVTRLYYLNKEMNSTTEKSTSIILIQKSVSMSVLLIICVISFLYLCRSISMDLSFFTQVLINLISIILILSLVLFLLFSKKLSIFFSKFENKVIIKINRFIKSYAHATSLINKKEWIIQYTISTIVWILFPIKMVILAYSFNLEVNFFILLAITMTSYMIGMLPLTPGGIGTFEGTMISLFSIVLVPTSVSTAIAIVFRIITFWFVMIISTIYVTLYRGRCKNEKTNS